MPRVGASLVIGVRPANPANGVLVRYRVDSGRIQSVPGREIRTDFARQVQYFAVAFPSFVSGDIVEYSPVLSCVGRQVPAAHVTDRFPSRFRLAAKDIGPKAAVPRLTKSSKRRFDVKLDHVADVNVYYGTPLYVGDTPTGMRINFLAKEGSVKGDGLNGKVLESSCDYMLVRPDGMGVVRIRAVFGLDDGAVIDVEAGGYVDFGPDGYRRAKDHDLPPRSPITLGPLLTTKHPKYHWLSRIQCIATGHTQVDKGWAHYRVYACTVPRQ